MGDDIFEPFDRARLNALRAQLATNAETTAMTLEKALHILANAHTRDDDLTGFVVEYVPSLEYRVEFTRSDYIEAWKTVRAHIHLQTEPKTN